MWDFLSSPTPLLLLPASPKSRIVFLRLSRPAPGRGGLAFLGFDARRMLASSGGKLERACAPSLSFSGISRRALGPWGPALAMSPSLKGDGDALPWRWRQVWRLFFASSPPATRLLSGRRCGGRCPPARPPAWSLVDETLEEGLRGEPPAGPVWPGGCSSHP